MKLPVVDARTLDQAIEAGDYGDYIYMYPPRQAYRRLGDDVDAQSRFSDSLQNASRINLYVHVPFCAQICRFCNLYTTAIHAADVYDKYVERLVDEVESYAQSGLIREGVRWPTIYFGGGTPSILPVSTLEAVVEDIQARLKVTGMEELALEVSPETVDAKYIKALRNAGFDRVSMGLQTTSPSELLAIGRRYSPEHQREVVDAALSAGFRNVCLDLIFGLPGQSLMSWEKSVSDVISLAPETICAYAWTSRPKTGFEKLGRVRPEGATLRRMHLMAHEMLVAAGYTQETHVRWVRGEGGYLQKKYHWGLETLLGLGPGARSYLESIDLRNGYSIGHRSDALNAYLHGEGFGWSADPTGILMSDDERKRKAVILGIHSLDRAWYRSLFGEDPSDKFAEFLNLLVDRDLVKVSDDHIALTDKGVAHRDIVVQLFFSSTTRKLVEEWRYVE